MVAPIPRLHVVTDDRVVGSPGFLNRARRVLEVGGSGLALHLRAPRTNGRSLFDYALALRDTAVTLQALLLVNDRVDVALAAEIDGVHLGERSLGVSVARALLGLDSVVGVSVHDTKALVRAVDNGANYAFVGTVHPTASHPGRPGMGLGGLARITAAAPEMRVMGIGGIGVEDVAGVVESGAHGVAVLSGIWSRSDPASAVCEYLAALEDLRMGGTRSAGMDRRQSTEETR